MRRKKLKGKYTDIKVSSLNKFINNNKLKLITISSFLVVLTAILLINSPKDNVFKSSYKKLLANNGIYTEEIKSIDITSDDYDEPGSFKVTKKAEWTDYGKAKLTITADSIIKPENNNKKDIILVMDVSGSMYGEKLNKAKEDAIDLTNNILSDNKNKIGLITFDTNAEIVFNLSNDINTINEKINSLTTKGNTNYNDALKKVDNMLENYQEQNNRDLIVLFLTDGNPCEDTPNEVSTYKILKEKYPSLTIQGIQYEMGSSITEALKNISDNQFNASIDTLGNVLIEASTNPIPYDEFIISDFIDTDYFEEPNVKDIKISIGSYELDGNKIIWNLGKSYMTGNKATLVVNLNQKERYIDEEGFYPTNEKETVKYNFEEKGETINSHDTPVLKNTYEVIYNTNAPVGCNVETPETEKHSVYNAVTVAATKLSCGGYTFKGWNIENDEDIKYINKTTFKMPARKIYINGTWSKQSIDKSMDGTVYTKPTLYNVLKNEAKIGTHAKEYTGEHADAYDRSGTKNIYYWYGSNNTNATAILDKFNVIFANFCWQMLRTTDTGGIKVIYNGIPTNGKCNNTGTAQQIGKSIYGISEKSIAYVGYMYNKVYEDKSVRTTSFPHRTENISYENYSSYYEIINDENFPWYFNNESKTWTSTMKEHSNNSSIFLKIKTDGDYVLKYTVSSENRYDYVYFYKNGTYITGASGNSTNYIDLDELIVGDTIEIRYSKNSSNSAGEDNVIISMGIPANEEDNRYLFGNDVEYVQGNYILKDAIRVTPITNLNKNHYTCFTSENSCEKVNYIYHSSIGELKYLELEDGKKINNALDDMLHADNVNTNDSTIKAYIDNWYLNNLIEYNDNLEDTVFCNERTILNFGGWNQNSVINSFLYFDEENPKKGLNCPHEEDRFSIFNNKAKLKYPVALASSSELNLLNYNNVRKTYQNYWTITPYVFTNIASMYTVDSSGYISSGALRHSYGVRPVVSLKPGTEYTDGDGSKEHPYIIDTEGD